MSMYVSYLSTLFQNGREYNAAVPRKLSESFGIDVSGASAVTSKQVKLLRTMKKGENYSEKGAHCNISVISVFHSPKLFHFESKIYGQNKIVYSWKN